MRAPDEFCKIAETAAQAQEIVTYNETAWPELNDATWRERVKLHMDYTYFTKFGFEFRADNQWHFHGISNPVPDRLAVLRH